jgi:hypothetical protein
MKLIGLTLILTILSFQLVAASWNFKKNLDANPPYNKCIEAISNGKDLGSSALKGKSKYANYLYEDFIYEIIINSSYMTCVRIDLSKDQKPYPLSKKK